MEGKLGIGNVKGRETDRQTERTRLIASVFMNLGVSCRFNHFLRCLERNIREETTRARSSIAKS